MLVDLHMHSSASDGLLTPRDLMEQCARLKLNLVALTDHDTVSGLKEAKEAARQLGLRFLPGIELSCNWGVTCIHVVGLNIREEDRFLADLTRDLSRKRAERALKMAERFNALGISGIYDVALSFALNKENISRSHFARALIQMKVIGNEQEAFDRFIGVEGPAYVPVDWPSLKEGIEYLHQAGGVAVLAHPGRYRLKEEWQRQALVESFCQARGDGIEVISGSQGSDYTRSGLEWAKKYHLLASTGSDFHRFEGGRPEPGSQGQLPEGLPTVYDAVK